MIVLVNQVISKIWMEIVRNVTINVKLVKTKVKIVKNVLNYLFTAINHLSVAVLKGIMKILIFNIV